MAGISDESVVFSFYLFIDLFIYLFIFETGSYRVALASLELPL